jgi:HAD superfamily hydrolase (TIGR01549 family)
MLNNQGEKTNKEVFLEYFSARSGLSQQEIWHRFMKFYENDFNQLETIVVQNPDAVKFLESAVAGKFSLVIATQPVFPEIAIRQRLRWAGLEKIRFKLITEIGNMKACKPSARYFEQILDILKVKPEECLMIGDDPVNDMASTRVGIANYFIGRGPDRKGDFSDLARILNLT